MLKYLEPENKFSPNLRNSLDNNDDAQRRALSRQKLLKTVNAVAEGQTFRKLQ